MGGLDADLPDSHVHQDLHMLVPTAHHGREMAKTADVHANWHQRSVHYDLCVPLFGYLQAIEFILDRRSRRQMSGERRG